MKIFIVLNEDDDILKVCDSEFLALKRLAYFKAANPGKEFTIKEQYLEREEFE
ncbi:hypothetical protein [Mucilaginibacter aquariorum]|uniref:Uncharacterized protein n=1 Tax=Mucilaginibacter aquariorum TaxID=2967225 RepID=A0ABT1T1P9_9SPHI|nr:hypothetical protein [Mucilaginibacter aquariorum]MCQ6957908.1 hypothetical protein [Mucilaginibacter aquariorum]